MELYPYPLDAKTLVRKKRTIKKELLAKENAWITKKIAILGGSTTNEVVDQLELALLYYGIKTEFYQTEYGRYWEEGVIDNLRLDAFSPDIIYVHTNWRNIRKFPSVDNSYDEVQELINSEFSRFEVLWDELGQKYNCPIIQNNFDRPNYRVMGNRDIWDYRGRSNYVFNLNSKIYNYAQEHESFYVNDIDYIAQECGIVKWNDATYWNMYKYICPINFIPFLSMSVANIIKSIFGKNKKLLALDLDNTLWGGVIGEEGIEGIKIGRETPQGQAYTEFQEYCKELRKMGVILAVNSKNEYDNAISGLSHPDGVLRPDDFAIIKANWSPKDENLCAIASELSLGIDSFVFVDDNPAERELICKQLASVTVPEVDSVDKYIDIIDKGGYFETTVLSEEDLIKTKQYKAMAEAKYAETLFKNYDDYLKSLNMKAIITDFEPIAIQRIAQLTNKTNQFNLTTCRCSENDIREMQFSGSYICLCGRLIDKFADNGIVSVVSGEIERDVLHIRLWLMSCRVLKRDMEYAMFDALIKECNRKGVYKIKGYYYPTAKNTLVKNFYSELGFSKVLENDDETIWEFDMSSYIKSHNKSICVELKL